MVSPRACSLVGTQATYILPYMRLYLYPKRKSASEKLSKQPWFENEYADTISPPGKQKRNGDGSATIYIYIYSLLLVFQTQKRYVLYVHETFPHYPQPVFLSFCVTPQHPTDTKRRETIISSASEHVESSPPPSWDG